MTDTSACPICSMTDLLESADGHECATCGHEWSTDMSATEPVLEVRDANGTLLQDGDAVTVVKDLKVKGGSSDIKVGTKITGIRLVEGDHDVDAKVGGQSIMLKAKFLKKA